MNTAKGTAPRPWAMMLDTWTALAATFCIVAGVDGLVDDMRTPGWWLQMWRTMWSLPPCSEARKAAFTLGHAALMIERWRKNTDPSEDDDRGACTRDGSASNGQRAEALLRICVWHIDDARIEAARPVVIGHHIRIYAHSQPVDPEHGGVNFCGILNDSDHRRVTVAMLDDFVRHAGERKAINRSDEEIMQFARHLSETLVASLPEGPWLVTSQDVWQLLNFLLEDCG